MVVDAGEDEDGFEGGCEEGGGDETTEQGKASRSAIAASAAVSFDCDRVDVRASAGAAQSSKGALISVIGCNRSAAGEGVRPLASTPVAAALGSTDTASIAILLIDPAAAPVGEISPALRLGESEDGIEWATLTVPGETLS